MARRRRSLLGNRGSSGGPDDERPQTEEEPLTDPGGGNAAAIAELSAPAPAAAPEDDLLPLATAADASPPVDPTPAPVDPTPAPPPVAAAPPTPVEATPSTAPPQLVSETQSTVRMERPEGLSRPARADAEDAWSPGWTPGAVDVDEPPPTPAARALREEERTPPTQSGYPVAAPEPPPPPARNGMLGATPPGDAPVPRDLFGGGGFDELEDLSPPTEERPPGVMEDVGQQYSTPYSVPEPPPIPGIIDRFTPPPAMRTDLGGRRSKPDYLADSPEGGAQRGYEPTPAPVKRKSSPKSQEPDDDDTSARRSGAPLLVLLGIGSVAVLGHGLVMLAGVIWMTSGSHNEGLSPDREVRSGGVEVRNNVHRQPELIGVQPDQPAEPVPLPPDPAPAPDPVPLAPAPAPSPAPTPGPAPVQAPRPTAPTSAPKPAPAAPAPAAQAQGTLKIRANRRAVVYVNDQAIGFTPLDHKVPPGTFTVAAMLPGQPGSRQEHTATVSAAGNVAPVDFQF